MRYKKNIFLHFFLSVYFSLQQVSAYTQGTVELYQIIYTNYSEDNTPLFMHEYIVLHGALRSVSYEKTVYKEQKISKEIIKDEVNMKVYKPTGDNPAYLYKDFQNELVYFETGVNQFFKKNKIYTDTIKLNWQLKNEVKQIGSLTCKKASVSFRGRTYTAWYTEELNISNGPWKFQGLPGLIIEVFDESKVVYWKVKSITKMNETLRELPTSADGDFAAFKEEFKSAYLRIKKSIEAPSDSNDPSCKSCGTSRTYTIDTPENLTKN